MQLFMNIFRAAIKQHIVLSETKTQLQLRFMLISLWPVWFTSIAEVHFVWSLKHCPPTLSLNVLSGSAFKKKKSLVLYPCCLPEENITPSTKFNKCTRNKQ